MSITEEVDRIRMSLSSPACVYCGIISPKLSPGFFIGKDGKPDIVSSIRRLFRRSDIFATIVQAIAALRDRLIRLQ